MRLFPLLPDAIILSLAEFQLGNKCRKTIDISRYKYL